MSDAIDSKGALRPEARQRVIDLAAAMQKPGAPEWIRYALRAAAGVPAGKLQEWLERNLARFAAEQRAPGGVFMCESPLPAQRPPALEYIGRRSVAYTSDGSYGDDVFVYRREKAPDPGRDSGAQRMD